jgi:hypothetical protein
VARMAAQSIGASNGTVTGKSSDGVDISELGGSGGPVTVLILFKA